MHICYLLDVYRQVRLQPQRRWETGFTQRVPPLGPPNQPRKARTDQVCAKQHTGGSTVGVRRGGRATLGESIASALQRDTALFGRVIGGATNAKMLPITAIGGRIEPPDTMVAADHAHPRIESAMWAGADTFPLMSNRAKRAVDPEPPDAWQTQVSGWRAKWPNNRQRVRAKTLSNGSCSALTRAEAISSLRPSWYWGQVPSSPVKSARGRLAMLWCV